ncbi:MAG: hypothetical protein JWO21_723 [Solirubrobacterales bacterium]|nr:hypothetical protein [Solirubrobacterales bacterium]
MAPQIDDLSVRSTPRGGRFGLALALCLGAVLCFAGVAQANVIVVTSTTDSGAGSVRSALVLANPGDTITIPTPGDYQVTSAELAVTKNVSIEGSGPAVRLVGDGNNRVLNVTAGSVTISRLTVTGGGLSGASVNGGGIANAAGTLELRNVTVTGNAVGNTPSGGIPRGGGIFNGTGTLVIVDSTISGNTNSIGPSGGGIPEGGGISNAGGSVTITHSAITGNTASIAAAGGIPVGAGINSSSGRLDLVDSTVSGNNAIGGSIPEGGGISSFNTVTTLTRTTVSGNAASVTSGGSVGVGGGVVQFKGSLSLVNSTITGNSAAGAAVSQGGGLEASETIATATNTTIAGNVASGPGGQAGNLFIANKSTFVPLNTIVANGTAATGPNCLIQAESTTSSQGHNLDSVAECGFTAAGDLFNANPLLSSLGDNGGSTQTMALAANSPAVNAGTNAGCPATDQRGVLRPAGSACDIGAFELATPSSTTGTAGAVTTTTATLNGVGRNPDLGGANAVFQYGPTASYGLSSPVQAIGPTTGQAALSAPVGGLTQGTLYHFRLVVQNGLATTYGADQTFKTVAVPTPPKPLLQPPSLSSVSVTNKRFRVSRRTTAVFARKAPLGTTFRFRLSAPAKVTIKITKTAPGLRRGHSCLAPSAKLRRKHAKRCTRILTLGTLTRSSEPTGSHRVAFSGRIGARPLRPGTYIAVVRASNAAGSSKPMSVSFTVVR